MLLRDDFGFNMEVLKQALAILRERTETSYYVHDMRAARPGNAVSNIRGVLTTGGKVAHIMLERTVEINDGDILTVRAADGRPLNYFVFDVQRNRFSPGKYTMHAVIWTMPMHGYGYREETRYDDMNGRRSAWIETAAA